jgi:hypothetical protein
MGPRTELSQEESAMGESDDTMEYDQEHFFKHLCVLFTVFLLVTNRTQRVLLGFA